MISNVYFYCPSRKIGGEQELYIRCANYLASYSSANIFYIDYPDGYAHCQLIEKVIRIDNASISDYKYPEDSLLIIALSYIDIFFKIFCKSDFSSGFRVLFWSLQPSNLTGKVLLRNKYNLMLPYQKREFRKVLESLCSAGIIRFMDYNNYYTLHEVFGLNLDVINYLPVPIEDDKIRPVSEISFQRQHYEKMSFMWLSRIDHDKKNTLMTVINELDETNNHNPCNLIVVGDGNALEEVQKYAANKSIEVDFVGRCFGDTLNRLIDDKVDIGVAMGMSGLEIAKRGKPVIMKQVMPKILPSGYVNDYIFLHQEYGFSLGSPDFYFDGQSDFETKISELQSSYSHYAKADYYYTRNNHSIKSTGGLLMEIIKQNGITGEQWDDIKCLVKLINNYRRLTFRRV